MKLLIGLLILLTFFVPFAFAEDLYLFETQKQREQFERLISDARCMVCQNEDLANSTSGFAIDMRNEVYQMVKEGKSNKEITQTMSAQYGYFISFASPFDWKIYLLW